MKFGELKHGTRKIKKLYKLRYQVYCKEVKYLTSQQCPGQLDYDKYDIQSYHFYAKDCNKIVGGARLIYNGEHKLPTLEHCEDLTIDRRTLPHTKTGEISRLVISKHLRKKTSSTPMDIYKTNRNIALGLYKEIYLKSKELGIEYWLTLMEPKLQLLLKLFHFDFEQIGEPIEHMGTVTPYLGDIAKIEQKLKKKNPKLYKEFTNGR